MKALVFAAGVGSRLAPITDTVPKALVEVGGRPMLSRVIERMRRAGAELVVVNVHHHAAKVRHFLSGRDFGVPVVVSDEEALLLDTGGGLLRASALLEDADCIAIHNADVLTDFPVEALVEEHRRRGSRATLLTSRRESSRRLLFSRAADELYAWENLKSGERIVAGPCADGYGRAFCGVSVVDASMLVDLRRYRRTLDSDVFPIIPFFLSEAGEGRGIRAMDLPEGYMWHDIGTLPRLEAARRAADASQASPESSL